MVSAPRTLLEAHTMLAGMRPQRSAPPGAWLSFYRRSAAMYAEIAEIDHGHHHEALYWASRERAKATALAAQSPHDSDQQDPQETLAELANNSTVIAEP